MSDPLDGFYAVLDGYIKRAVDPLRETIATQAATIVAQANVVESLRGEVRSALEKSSRAVIMHGVDGKDGEKGAVGERGLPGEKGADGKDGRDGKDVDFDALAALVSERVAAAVAALPKPKDGRDGADGLDGRDGVDGKSVDLNDVAGLVADRVDEAVARIPKAKDGRDGVDGKDGKSAVEIARSHGFAGSDLDWLASLRGKDGDDGRDGVSVLSALVDGDGELVLTASDGTRHKAGGVRGRDGKDGQNGRDGAQGDAGRDAASMRLLPYIDDEKAYPAGSWAAHAGGSWFANEQTEPLAGRNPQDAGWTPHAIGEQSLAISLADDERTLVVRRRSSVGSMLESRFTLPVVLDRGVYIASKRYARGDGITRAGSFYIARVDDPKGAPGASDDWRLAVKAGKDGKP
jgi:hypothetical protein